ncbi:aspartate/glutamate racemase family protein [Streptomyces parvulus]
MLALLHTSPVHVPVFDALRDAAHPGLDLRHHVHAELLERARREGPEAVTEAVGDVLRRAVAQGARAVLCTCSTIGAVAESAAAGVPVLRVDRPMAATAVAAGPRVVVLAALRSTLAPTAVLVEEEAGRAGRPLLLRTRLVEGAWDRFEAGDTEGYLRLVAEAAEAVTADDTDVIVLAQASMALAREAARTPVPVLASPALGLAAGAAAARLGHLDPAGSCGGVSAEAGVG